MHPTTSGRWRPSDSAAAWGAALLALAVAAGFPWKKPGLQYDEALFVRDAVQLLTGSPPQFAREVRSWIPQGLPLMDLPYAGPIKGYLITAPFALFGTSAAVCRGFSALLAAVGIWGIARAQAQLVSPGTGFAVGAVLAVHPALLDQTLYDNSAVALWILTLGMVALALSAFLRAPSNGRAWIVGFTCGFAVWGRLNFLWLLAAGAVAAAVCVRETWLAARRHGLAVALGFFVGSAPVLVYEAVTRLGTLRFIARVRVPWAVRWRLRLPGLAETLLSDAEHRGIWGGPPLPSWQIVFTASLVTMSVLLAFFVRRGPEETGAAYAWRRTVALTCVLFSALNVASGQQVAEHHLVTVVPLAAAVAVLAIRRIAAEGAMFRVAAVGASVLFLALCVVWDLRAIAGIRATGGKHHWSDAIEQVAETARSVAPGRRVRTLSWGLSNNIFVLTQGACAPEDEFFWATADRSRRGRSWEDEAREPGWFLLGIQRSPAGESFRRALEAARTPSRRWTFRQRNGDFYAELIEILPSGAAASR